MAPVALSSPGQTVVIVEDDRDLLHSLRFSLELEGWAVVAYASAEALLAGDPLPANGCLLIDHVLPGTSGLDLLLELRRRGVRLPAIIITTNPHHQLRRQAAEGSAVIVEKPLLGASLTDAIRHVLDTPTEPPSGPDRFV